MKDEGKDNEEGLPRWVKATGAVVGIIATAATILTGIYAIFLQTRETLTSLEKERTEQQTAVQKSEEARTAQMRTRLEADKIAFDKAAQEREGRLAVEREKTLQAEAAERAAKLCFDLEAREQEMTVRTRERELESQQEREFLQAISKILDQKGGSSKTPEDKLSSMSNLLVISSFAQAHLKYQDLAADALTTRLEQEITLTEMRLIFRLLRDLGPDAFDEVVEVNRMAYTDYRKLLMASFSGLVDDYSSDEKGRCEALRDLPDGMQARHIQPLVQQIIAFDYLKAGPENLEPIPEEPSGVGREDFFDGLYAIEEVIEQSRLIIRDRLPEALSEASKAGRRLDLSRTYLVGIGDLERLPAERAILTGAMVFELSPASLPAGGVPTPARLFG